MLLSSYLFNALSKSPSIIYQVFLLMLLSRLFFHASIEIFVQCSIRITFNCYFRIPSNALLRLILMVLLGSPLMHCWDSSPMVLSGSPLMHCQDCFRWLFRGKKAMSLKAPLPYFSFIKLAFSI